MRNKTALVGRKTELQILRDALNDALAGQGSLWLIEGVSGVGKSRLIDELTQDKLANDFVVARGHGRSNTGLPYQLWRDVMPPLIMNVELSDLEASVLREIIPTIDELAGRTVAPAPTLEGERGQDRLIAVMQAILERQPQPVMLIFEDLQWITDSLIPLQRLVPALTHQRFLILGTYESEKTKQLAQELPTAQFLNLPELPINEADHLFNKLLGQVSLEWITKTESLPFFIVEAAQFLQENPTSELPPEIRTILHGRLAHFSSEHRRLLEFTAILGDPFDLKVLQNLMPAADLKQWLAVGESLGVFRRDTQWQFAHEEWRQAVLRGIASNRLPELYREVASAIEYLHDTHLYAEILMHYWQSAQDPTRELHYLLLVADAMVNYSARFGAARDLLEHGRSLVQGDPPAKLIFLLGNCIENIRSYNQAIELYNQSNALAQNENNPYLQVDSLNRKAMVFHIQSRYDDAFAVAQDALNLAQTLGYDKGSAEAFTTMAYNSFHLKGNHLAGEYYEEALALYRQMGYLTGIATNLRNLGILACYNCEYELALQYLGEGLVIDEQLGSQMGISASLNNLGLACLYNGQFGEAHQHLTRALAIRQASGYPLGVAASLVNLGLLAYYQGDYEQAELMFTEALKIRQSLWFPWGMGEAFLHLGNIARQQNNIALAENYYNEAITIYNRIGEPIGRLFTFFGQNCLQFQRHTIINKATLQAHLELALEPNIPNLMLIALTQVAGWYWQTRRAETAIRLWQWVAGHERCDIIVQNTLNFIWRELGVEPIAMSPTHSDDIVLRIREVLADLANE